MAMELAFVLINPYTIAKSRTGGVIGRYINRTDLDMVAARIFGPSRDLVTEYAEHLRSDRDNPVVANLLADYVMKSYVPDASGKPRRVMMLLFEGEDAINRVWRATGSATLRWGSGETIRDTYGDYILDEQGKVTYFEPAVLASPSRSRAAESLRIWASRSETEGGIITGGTDVASDNDVEQTLVLLKPDGFRFHSSRPGNIIDILSLSGLRIVGAKKFRMTVAQAEEFYGPVREALKERLKDSTGTRAADAVARELGVVIPEAVRKSLGEQMGPIVGEKEFESIVKFMTGYRPSECAAADKARLCGEECLALVYRGKEAVNKIRRLLGSTDPAKAVPGSVRREFGSNILVNAAHASDSVDNARREIGIVNVAEDNIKAWYEKYYGRSAAPATA